MSFFDEDDEPRRTSGSRRTGPGGATTDRQTLLVRRAVALAAGLLVLLLLVFAVRGCLESRERNGLRDYTRDVSGIAEESERQVAQPFFELIGQRGNESPQDLQTGISGFRVTAETQLDQAEDLNVPDAMVPAHRSLLETLQFRRDGLDFIAQRIRTALGDQGEASERAVTAISNQMAGFLASDVIYDARVRPLIQGALDREEVGGIRPARSRFLPVVSWLSQQTVASRLGQRVGTGAGGRTRTPAPGRHGTGLDSVSVNGLRLSTDAPNRIPLSEQLTFAVRFTNQGEHPEFDVRVGLVVEGGGRPIRVATTVDTVAQGGSAVANLRLPQRPPTDAAVTIRVQVDAVPGEQLTTNNRAQYQAAFVAP